MRINKHNSDETNYKMNSDINYKQRPSMIKGSIFLKNRHFIIQERFSKLHNHKMWHLTACKISVNLSFLNWIKKMK